MITIRSYQNNDEQAVKECIHQLKKYESALDSDFLSDQDSVDALHADITQAIGEKGQVFVAESQDEVVGFASVTVEHKNDPLICKKIETVYVSDIVVIKKMRGKGIGARLMQAVETYAKEKNIEYIKLIILSDNTQAEQFYRKAGFKDYEKTLLKKLS